MQIKYFHKYYTYNYANFFKKIFNKTVQKVFPLKPDIVNPPCVLATRCSHESTQSCNILERARAT